MNEQKLRNVIEIGVQLTTEKNINRLLSMILTCAMDLTNCDAGTLYLYENESLVFTVMKTISQNVNQGQNGEVISLPPVPLKEENVCAYTAIHRELINVKDVYHDERFDFSGPKKYDSITGFHTRSMLVSPLVDVEGNLIGVLQLINSLDEDGNIIAFDSQNEYVIRSLASQAAVAISNTRYIREIKQQLYSFAEAFATAIDQRTPYNGSHTRKVVEYAGVLGRYIQKLHLAGKCEESFDEQRLETLELSAALHDIGKMIVPLSVMNKATRLDGKMEALKSRYGYIELSLENDMLRGRISKEQADTEIAYLKEALNFIESIDAGGFLPDEKLERVDEIAGHIYTKEDGTVYPYLTEEEHNCLKIRKGTLTAEERVEMENHVVMTAKILEKVHFQKQYEKVPYFAASHHELLDGSGYPNHVTAEHLELEPRIIAVVDVYDALTCTDRPYKTPIPKEKAFGILESMAEEGKLEMRLVKWLHEAVDAEEGNRESE